MSKRLVDPAGRTTMEHIRDGRDAWAAPINRQREYAAERRRNRFTGKERFWVWMTVPFSLLCGAIAFVVASLLR